MPPTIFVLITAAAAVTTPLAAWLLGRADAPIPVWRATALTAAGVAAVTGRRLSGGWPCWWLPVPVLLTVVAVPLALADLRHLRLPDVLTLPAYPLFGTALGAAALGGGGPSLAVHAAAGTLLFGGAHALVARMAPASLGRGDVKLSGSLGAVLGAAGWPDLALAPILAALFSLAIAIARSTVQRRPDDRARPASAQRPAPIADREPALDQLPGPLPAPDPHLAPGPHRSPDPVSAAGPRPAPDPALAPHSGLHPSPAPAPHPGPHPAPASDPRPAPDPAVDPSLAPDPAPAPRLTPDPAPAPRLAPDPALAPHPGLHPAPAPAPRLAPPPTPVPTTRPAPIPPPTSPFGGHRVPHGPALLAATWLCALFPGAP